MDFHSQPEATSWLSLSSADAASLPRPAWGAEMAGSSADHAAFFRAVLLNFDLAAEPGARQQATASLEQLRASPEGWCFCLQAFGVAQEEQVKFWCLQTLVDMVVRERRCAQKKRSARTQRSTRSACCC